MGEPTKYILFESAGERLAVPLQKVSEISNFVKSSATIAPSSPYIQGTCNLRGIAVPIINLAKAIGFLSSRKNDPTSILVIRTDRIRQPRLMGVPVDCIYSIETVSDDRIRPVASSSSSELNGFLLGTISLDGETQLILDVEWLACLLDSADDAADRSAAIRATADSRLSIV